MKFHSLIIMPILKFKTRGQGRRVTIKFSAQPFGLPKIDKINTTVSGLRVHDVVDVSTQLFQ